MQELTAKSLNDFVKEHLNCEEANQPCDYSIDVAGVGQAKVTLRVPVGEIDPYKFVSAWVDVFGSGYQVLLTQDMQDGQTITNGFIFWVDFAAHKDIFTPPSVIAQLEQQEELLPDKPKSPIYGRDSTEKEKVFPPMGSWKDRKRTY